MTDQGKGQVPMLERWNLDDGLPDVFLGRDGRLVIQKPGETEAKVYYPGDVGYDRPLAERLAMHTYRKSLAALIAEARQSK